MAKSRNLAFLEGVCPVAVKDRTYEGLLTWLFGTDERTIDVCAWVAYEYMKRKLIRANRLPWKDERTYWADIKEMNFTSLEDLFTRTKFCFGLEAFDNWHNNVCENLCEISYKYNINDLTYGHAQLWVNFTLKNMLIMERWDKYLEPIGDYLHIPVDGFIIEAASKKLGITAIDKPWIRWDYGDYIKFQEDVRNAVDCPMDWEFSVWSKANIE